MAHIILFGTPGKFSHSDLKGVRTEFLSKYIGDYSDMVSKQSFDANGSHYILLIYQNSGKQFLDTQGNPGCFLGIDLVIPDKKFFNPSTVRALLIKTYETYIKDKLVQELPNGDRKFIVSSLDDKMADDVYTGLMNITKTNPELDVFKVNPNQSLFEALKSSQGYKL